MCDVGEGLAPQGNIKFRVILSEAQSAKSKDPVVIRGFFDAGKALAQNDIHLRRGRKKPAAMPLAFSYPVIFSNS